MITNRRFQDNLQCGKRIERLIKKSGLSNRALARKIKVSPTTIQSVGLGRNITLNTICKFAIYFNVSLDYLVFGEMVEKAEEMGCYEGSRR
jgi:transcriptional regulator with XRE-family HTH domain